MRILTDNKEISCLVRPYRSAYTKLSIYRLKLFITFAVHLRLTFTVHRTTTSVYVTR